MGTSGKFRHIKENLTGYQSFIEVSNILEKIIITTLFASALLFKVWSRDGIGLAARAIAVIFFFTLVSFFINRNGYPRTAGNIFFIMMVAVLTYLSIDGDGIYNVPFIFFPILLIFSGILYGKQMVATYTGIIVGLAILLFWLDRAHFIVPFEEVVTFAPDYFAIVVIILLATGAILHLVMGKIEHNLEQIVGAEQAIKQTYELTLKSWAKALELGGRETPGHSQRVTNLVMEFTEYLQLEDTVREEIIKGALLHDIGKMGIPDSILLKPGKLVKEEFEYSKQHVEFSSQILQDVSDFETAMHIPVYHHEQWDGKGYPQCLAGNDIPFAARVFAIIDNWDSLTNHQVYRDAWSKEKAISYLQQQAGKKFDANIIEAFLKFLDLDHEANSPE